MQLQMISSILKSIVIDTFHYHATESPDNYIVWAEKSEGNSLHADNKKQAQVIQGTVDYFTKTEYDPNVQEIQKALTENKISWRLNSVQYEAETAYIHHEWIFEIEIALNNN